MLALSENGFDSLIISKVKAKKCWTLSGLQTLEYEELTVKQMIDFLLKHPWLLRTPILFEEDRLLVVYNGEEIRMFIPRDYRQIMQRKFI